MPGRLHLMLAPETREELEKLRRTSPLPYLRERATALLKIADGTSGRAVASDGLLQDRCSDTVYRWVHRFEVEGLDGLRIRPGRGRKPAFSPSADGQRSGGDTVSAPPRPAHLRAGA